MNEDIYIQCVCGEEWNVDYDPAPSCCWGLMRRIKVGEFATWGPWVDEDGKEIIPDIINTKETNANDE